MKKQIITKRNETVTMDKWSMKELNVKEFTQIYQTYMTQDFPKAELKPLERMQYTMQTGLTCVFGLYKNNELRAYAVFIIPKGLDYGLLDYLAVIKEYRGTGAGHRFFELVGDVLRKKYPWLRGFFIESENIDFAQNDIEREIRTRRIAFYKNNGCSLTRLGSRLFGVTYSILLYDFDKNNSGEKMYAAVDGIYAAMFQKHHYENEVSLWEVD